MAENTESVALRQIAADAPRYSGYKALGPRQIRLLGLQEGLRCRLFHVGIDNTPGYNALSYYWGAPSKELAIYVNDKEVLVRKTLYSFLQSLYKQYGSMTVWLDVICINQRDAAEQSAQVTMMGEIYASASRVYSWLGEGDSDIAYAMGRLNSEDWQQNGAEYANVGDRHLSIDKEHRRRERSRLMLVQSDEHLKAGLERMCLARYWTRVWTIQECLVNPNVVLIYDDTSTGFDSLMSKTTLESVPPFLQDRLGPFHQARTMWRQQQKYRLLELAQMFAASQCKDARDTFYGFRALASDGQGLTVDYTWSPVDILFHATSRQHWASFLHWCGCTDTDCTCVAGDYSGRWYTNVAGSCCSYTRETEPANYTPLGSLCSEFSKIWVSLCFFNSPADVLTASLTDWPQDWLVEGVVPVAQSPASHQAIKSVFPDYDTGRHNLFENRTSKVAWLYVKLLIVLNKVNREVVAATITWTDGLDPSSGFFADFASSLQSVMVRMASRHMWPCRVTWGVHLSRLFLMMLAMVHHRQVLFRSKAAVQ